MGPSPPSPLVSGGGGDRALVPSVAGRWWQPKVRMERWREVGDERE